MGNPIEHGKEPLAAPAQAAQGEAAGPDSQGFPATQVDENAPIDTDWWSESTDGQCSENAALFAASQPAPLSIV